MTDTTRRRSPRLNPETSSEQIEDYDIKDAMSLDAPDNIDSKSEQESTVKTSSDVYIFGRRFNKVILVTHINIFLYATCFWIQTGVLPYLTKRLGADAVMFGYLQTTFAIVQLAGGPLFGRFGDLFGGRYALVLAFMSAALSYLLLSVSTSVPILFLSRLPSVFMHAMQGGQMIVTDMGDTEMRADALGKLGLSYGVGMVIGPVLGGLLTKNLGEESSAFIAFLGSLLSVALVLLYVPKQTKAAKVEERSTGLLSFKKWASLILAPGALFLLVLRVATGIPIGVFQSMFQVVALETFKLPADQNGYLMSYIGILSMIVQGFGVGVLLKRASEDWVLKWASFLLVWSYLALSFVTTIPQLCIVFAPLVMGLASQNIVISSSLTKTVKEIDTGAMLGLNMATNSLIRSVSPTIGGIMLEKLGFSSFGYFGFLASGLVTAVLFIKLRNKA